MNNYRINNHYAKALMLFAQEQGVEDRVAEDMRLVSDVWAENRELNAPARYTCGVSPTPMSRCGATTGVS